MPNSTFVEIPEEEQAPMLAALRVRYGSLLALHILLVSAAARTPTVIAAVLFCSHSSVYRAVQASREGSRGWRSNSDGQRLPPVCHTGCCPYSGGRAWSCARRPCGLMGDASTSWSGATLALTL